MVVCFPLVMFLSDMELRITQLQAELAVSKFLGNGAGIISAASTIASTFVLVFIAEWGDKSFFSTIGKSHKLILY